MFYFMKFGTPYTVIYTPYTVIYKFIIKNNVMWNSRMFCKFQKGLLT